MEALIGMKPNLENEVNANCLVGLQNVDRRIHKKIQEKFDQKSLNDLLSQETNVRERARLLLVSLLESLFLLVMQVLG